MKLSIVKVGYLETNCYILEKQEECLIIDPGDDYFAINRMLGNKKVLAILLTHRHPDHIGALSLLLADHTVPIYDKNSLEETEYHIGTFSFRVLFTPGHTEDSVSYHFYIENMMFTGDFLFKNTVGRWDLETGDRSKMYESLAKMQAYPNQLNIYPGHGEITTLQEERKNNPYFNGREE